MSAGGVGFFNWFTPWGGGEGERRSLRWWPGQGVAFTPSADSKDQEEDPEPEGSPLGTRQSMTLPTMTGSTTTEIITLSVPPSAMLNTKPGGTLVLGY